jgi:hypothetical protein
MATSTPEIAFNGPHRIFHPARHFAGHGTPWSCQRHQDLDHPVVLDVDLVDEPEFVDVGGNFRVVNGFESPK